MNLKYLAGTVLISVLLSVVLRGQVISSDTTADNAATGVRAEELAGNYWNIQYHPQINTELFKLIGYPYYPGGESFVRSSASKTAGIYFSTDHRDNQHKNFNSDLLKALNKLVAELIAEELAKDSRGLEVDNDNPLTESIADANDIKVDLGSDAISELELVVEKSGKTLDLPVNIDDTICISRGNIERCSELICRWRQVNESPVFMLEVLRSVKITETTSGIYQADPEIAVLIKRNIGSIAKLNKNFDFTVRIAFESVLSGENPKPWISRLEKQLADLGNRALVLRDLNDKASYALGLGNIDRSGDTLSYSNITFEAIKKPDSRMMK
ncbi:MAG: hypothetical protein JW745_07815 [Sedimentisphaerales bacterium]|nr:hypothetical protein [Sedimentisphaerales bacterium]